MNDTDVQVVNCPSEPALFQSIKLNRFANLKESNSIVHLRIVQVSILDSKNKKVFDELRRFGVPLSLLFPSDVCILVCDFSECETSRECISRIVAGLIVYLHL